LSRFFDAIQQFTAIKLKNFEKLKNRTWIILCALVKVELLTVKLSLEGAASQVQIFQN